MNTALMQSHEDSHSIGDREFGAISKLVYENFGIVLGAEKRSLVVGRLHGCLQKRGIPSFSDYLRKLKNDPGLELLSELVNQISTNFTSFYRESTHFDYLADKALPEVMRMLEAQRSNDLRVWCAACSSGEEAYTLQMTIQKKLGIQYKDLDGGMLATDISTKVLDLARQGVYSAEQLENVPKELLRSHFQDQGSGRFAVKDSLKKEILFRRFNLMNGHFPFKNRFQIIFCRNVMIYFDEPTRRQLVTKFYDLLEPGGYLFIGHSETVGSGWCDFQNVQSAVYRKRA